MREFEMISGMIVILAKISMGLLVVYNGWKYLAHSDPVCAGAKPTKCAVWAVVLFVAAAAAVFREDSLTAEIWDILFWASMTLAALEDYMTGEVHDICYLPALATGAYRMVMRGTWEGSVDLLVFAGSLSLLCKIFTIIRGGFGTSDCIALWTCALYMTADGAGRWDYVYLTAGVAALSGIVQMCKGNVTGGIRSGGILKKEVALVPYIVVVNFIFRWIVR